MSRLRVISPGFLTTVQDLGRFGWAHFGVSASGAADALALRAGNLLVGNTENAAALEMTLQDESFLAEAGKQNLPLDPVSGAEAQAIIQAIYATPPQLARKVKAVLE